MASSKIISRLVPWIVSGLSALLALVLILNPWGAALDRWLSDQWFQLRGRLTAPEDIVIVGIDEPSITYLKLRWPWSRDLHAKLITTLNEAGAKLIVFDVLLDQPERPTGPTEADHRLAEVLDRYPNVILATGRDNEKTPTYTRWTWLDPLPLFQRSDHRVAVRVAVSNLPRDPDNVIRRLFTHIEDRPSLSYAAADRYHGVYIDSPRTVIINFQGPPKTVKTVSYYQALEHHKFLPVGIFKDKLVFVGTTSKVANSREADRFPVPFVDAGGQQLMAGVEIFAQATHNLLTDSYLRPGSVAQARILGLGLALVCGLLLFARPLWGTATFIMVTLVSLIVSYRVFCNDNLLFPIAQTLVPVGVAFSTGVAYRIIEAVRRPTIDPEDLKRLGLILAQQATADEPSSPDRFFPDLLRRADLPERWARQLAGIWTHDTETDAQRLIRWASGKGRHPRNPETTVLGAILDALLRDGLRFEDRATLTATIVTYRLYHESALERLKQRYPFPEYVAPESPASAIGPDIDWHGPTDKVELQAWLQPQTQWLDVGSLRAAMMCAAAVCRVELPVLKRMGTGFLITPKLLLTNYHLLKQRPEEDIWDNAGQLWLRFGYITPESDTATDGQCYRLDSKQPIICMSPTEELDYVLLKVETRIIQADDVRPVTYSLGLPEPRSGLHILQHPSGAMMKLALSDDGVTTVDPESGLVQYVTRTAAGSSGAPCFDTSWQLIALHHAERSRSFGCIREGILFSTIHREIKQYL